MSLPKHVKNYLEAMGFDKSSFIPCEWCGAEAAEIHHIQPRSSFGSKRKEEQDHIGNLIALCRDCHNTAHGPGSRKYKIVLQEIADTRAFQRI